MKYATSFRISDQARALLDRMARETSIAHTAMLEILIREGAKKRGIRADSGVQTESQSGPKPRD
jgi:predicted transcriptional regulator